MSAKFSSPPTHGGGTDEPNRPDLDESLRALREATQRLAASANPAGEHPDEKPRPAQPAEASPMSVDDSEEQIYYQRLEQTGKLAEINSEAEIRSLSPRITHVRLPDGSIRRVGYSID